MQLLLCTDLDRTVLPNGPQPESCNARMRFSTLATRPEVTLVYVTGRDLQLTQKAITDYNIPRPDYIIGDVGTTLYDTHQGHWRLWSAWQQEISADWAGFNHHYLKKRLLDIIDLQPQEPTKQNKYKLSFYVPLYADTEALSRDIYQRLESSNIMANLVWSIDEPRGICLLDILPASAGKKHALLFLMERKGFALSDTIFAGDSGNDLPVLSSEIPAVLVANASDEVRIEALAQASVQQHTDALYIARGNFMSMNGNYTAGVLEGVIHYKPEISHWLTEHVNTDVEHD